MFLRAHRELALGLDLQICARDREIVCNNVSYSDDNDGHVLTLYEEDNEHGCVTEGLRVSSKK